MESPVSKTERRYVPRRFKELPTDTAPAVVWEPLSARVRAMAHAAALSTGYSDHNDVPLWIAIVDRAVTRLENWPEPRAVVAGKAADAFDDEMLIIEIGAELYRQMRLSVRDEGKSPSRSGSGTADSATSAPPVS